MLVRAKGWQPPSVYQGMYNAVTREVEKELLPALHALGMRFYAYNPLVSREIRGRAYIRVYPMFGSWVVGDIMKDFSREREGEMELKALSRGSLTTRGRIMRSWGDPFGRSSQECF